MAYTLTITVGGLCMLVQKTDDPKGLYILMPGHGSGTMKHCPVLLADAPYIGGKNLLVPFKRHEDLYDLADAPGVGTMPGDMLLQPSKYDGKRVADECFHVRTPRCLAVRIRLPLSSDVRHVPHPLTAQLEVPDSSAPGGTSIRPFVGSVIVTVQVDSREDLPIAGKTLVPHAGEIKLMVLNVPRSEWEGKKMGSIKRHEAKHVEAYYGLLGDNCDSGHKGPPVLYGEDSPMVGGAPGPLGCPVNEEDGPIIPKKEEVRWIDPANCTVGIGDG